MIDGQQNYAGFVLALISLLTLTSACVVSPAVSEEDGYVAFAYELEEAGSVSAAVYDDEGRLVRELLHAVSQEAGEHTLRWDGLDRDGNPVKKGTYEWRVLRTPGFRAEYITSLGINPGTNPYERWVGNHGGPVSVAVDSTGMYLAAQITETAPVLLKQSLDGTERFWTQGRGGVTHGRFQGGAALASDGEGMLYMLQQNGRLQPIDAETGKVQISKYHRGGKWDPLPDALKQSIDNRKEVRQRYKHKNPGADIGAYGDTLVICFEKQNSLRWLSKDDGSVKKKVDISSPRAVAVDHQENVYVLSDEKILRVQETGAATPVVTEDLTAPYQFAIAPESGDYLVVEGSPDNRIKRFSADGDLKRTYGRKGGRKQGPYEPTDFRGVTNIAAMPDGGFVVAEPKVAPRRVAHFDAEGKLVDEWYGGQPYYAWGEPDPRDPSRVWFNPGGWLTLAEIDYETGEWEVLENYLPGDLADGLVATVTGHRGRWRVLYRGDQRYLVSESSPQVLIHKNGSLRAVTVVSRHGKNLKKAKEIAGYEGEARSFRWLDNNSDGIPQADEFDFSVDRNVPSGNRGVSDNFELLNVGSGRDDDGQNWLRVAKTIPDWTDNLPVYPFGGESGVNETAAKAAVSAGVGTGGTRGVAAFRDQEGGYYATYLTGDDRHGQSWPTLWGARARLVRWDARGNERWRGGRHAVHGGLGGNPHTTPPGYLHVPAAIIGEVHDTVVVTDRVESMGQVWTRDGLYVGDVLDGRVDDGLPAKVYYWWRTPEGNEAIITSDNATGGAIVEDDDGNVYFFTQGRNSVPTYRLHGWDNWTRHSGHVEIKEEPAHARAEGRGLNAAYYVESNISGDPDEQQVEERVWHGVPKGKDGYHRVIDGSRNDPVYDWSETVKPLEQGADKTFCVRWTGKIEAPLTEEFTFSVYHRGKVRLWIDGTQRIFGWNTSRSRRETEPIPLEAGHRYSVQLDFCSTGKNPSCSLNWESPSLDRRRIAQKYVYPTDIAEADQPDPRSATEKIRAREFDTTNIETDDGRRYTSGLRHRGIGKPGAYLGYERIDFGDGVSELSVGGKGQPAGDGDYDLVLDFRLESPDGRTIGSVVLDEEAGKQSVSLDEEVTGEHDLYVINATDGGWHFIHFYWFQFE